VGRVEDVVAGTDTLRVADLTNAATREAGHNTVSLEEILARFRALRAAPAPRVPMRVVDLCFFVAEHDDAHLARVREWQRLGG